jgi:hypothetical protein
VTPPYIIAPTNEQQTDRLEENWNGVLLFGMRAILILICAGCLLAGAALAQSPVTVTVDTQSPGHAIPDDFTGLSVETGSQRLGQNGVSGYLFSPANTQLITLFQNSGIHHLRVGGGTVDGTSAVLLDNPAIDNLFGFAQAAGVKVIYSLQLLNGNATTDAVTAQYIWQRYQSLLDGFSIGNEPDFKSYDYPPFGTGTDPLITNYPSYLVDWRNFAAAITNVAPAAKFAGPDTGDYTGSTYYNGQSWTEHFANDERTSGIIAMITQHYYVGGSPGSTTVLQVINNMLSPGWVTNNYPWLYNNNLFPVVADGLSYRLTESNDYLTGITNASDAFASALWALDYMHWWAMHGCAGVNFHNKPWLKTDTLYLDTASGNYRINPKAYGIKAFDLGGHGFVEPVVVTNVNDLNLTAYAVGDTTNLYVTIINKEHGNGARDASVTITPGGISSGNVSKMILTDGKSGDASLTTNITLGGAYITNNAPWLGQWTELNTFTNGQCTLTVTAASAAIVRIQASAVSVPPVTLSIQKYENNQLQLNWNYGTLQSATNFTGPYDDVTRATAPYAIPTTNAQQFYRVREN